MSAMADYDGKLRVQLDRPAEVKLSNYLVQAKQAEEWLRAQWARLLAEGYIEVAPGVLRHPETGAEVWNG